jgi:cysteine desulfurase
MSFSGHKVYGPKGIGALYVRHAPQVRLLAQIHGGGQERGLRGGTLPTHQIAAMGAAFEIAQSDRAAESERISGLRDRLWCGLQSLGSIHQNGDPRRCVAGILNVSFAGVDRESLIAELDDVAISAGSACSSSGFEPSHVLRALGCDEERVRSAIRFSIGRFTAVEEIDHTIAAVRRAVRRLRAMSPLWDSTTSTGTLELEGSASALREQV